MYTDMKEWYYPSKTKTKQKRKPKQKQKHETEEDMECIPQGVVKASTIKCYDYKGQVLWKMARHSPDGKLIDPINITADDEGHVFVSDQFNKRVLVTGLDDSFIQSVETLIVTPGEAGYVEWQKETNQLVVMYHNADDSKILSARYDISKICQPQIDETL